MVPWRFILILIILIIVVVFVGMNLNNTADIRFWAGDKGEATINVIFALFGAFITGVIITLPYVFKKRIHYVDMTKAKAKKEKAQRKVNSKNKTQFSDSDVESAALGAKRAKSTKSPKSTQSPLEFQSLKNKKGE